MPKIINKNILKITVIFIFFLANIPLHAIPSVLFKYVLEDSLELTALQKKIRYDKRFSFVNYDQNHLEWSSFSAIKPFFDKLKLADKQKVKVLHIGDSHVHFDMQCGTIRNGMQEIFGYGGRGSVATYSLAGAHASYDYNTSHKGRWKGTKNTNNTNSLSLGITGITGRTEDSTASFKVNFVAGSEIKENYKTIKIYCQQSPESFDLLVKYATDKEPIFVSASNLGSQNNKKPYIEVALPQTSNNLQFLIKKSNANQKFFEVHGIMIESNENSGILYNSVGVNGAGLNNILRQNLLGEHIKDMLPDLVVIDLGVNDFYAGNTLNENQAEENLKKIINNIRENSPNTVILLTNPQDTYFGTRNITAGEQYAALTRRIAFENNCAFYDYFQISGGRCSMLKWQSHGLAKSDRIHLTNGGYRVKGELYMNALLNAFSTSLTKTELDNFVVKHRKPTVIIPAELPMEKEKQKVLAVAYSPNANATANIPTNTKKQIHTVKYGESLGLIGNLYGVNMQNLQQWNNLPNNFIVVNQKIIVYSNKNITPVVVAKVETKKNETKKIEPVVKPDNKQVTVTPAKKLLKKLEIVIPTFGSRKTFHTVTSGDNLWFLANKYNVSVEQIQKLNTMKDNKLNIGMVLLIKN